jgi:hypothetical protein
VLLALLAPAAAHAGAYLRVISLRAPVHTGPGAGYREIDTVARGTVLAVLERATTGYWFRVELDDGTTGWILGDLVHPFEHRPSPPTGVIARIGRGIEDHLLGPSPLAGSRIELSFSAGTLSGEGMFLFRPAYLLDPHVAFEAHVGINARGQSDVFLGGLGWTLRLLPGAPVGPFVHASFGAAHRRPKADNFTETEATLFAVSAGGGLEITLKKQITLRIDARNWTLFDPDEAANTQEFSGGLAIFF